MTKLGKVIISRTDSIGDVMLTLPIAGHLKRLDPQCHIVMLCKDYTRPVVNCCAHVDEVLSYDDLVQNDALHQLKETNADVILHIFPQKKVAKWSKQVGIGTRIGTSHRAFHWSTCNKLLNFTRKRSDLHEAQLNFKLLKPLGVDAIPSIQQLAESFGFKAPKPDERVLQVLRQSRKNIILHPGSKGSAVEWGLANFSKLVKLLDPSEFHVLITGTESEGSSFRSELPLEMEHVTDVSGKLSLDQLMALINECDALVAASTGPLHIAAACGIRAIGLYSQRRPIHPGRWAPIGKDAHALTSEGICKKCASGADCHCIQLIAPERIKELLVAL